MAFTEDLSAFLNTGEFADTGTYAGSTSVDGILDQQSVEVFGIESGVRTVQTVFIYDATALSAAAGNTLVVAGTSYTVRDVEVTNGLGRMLLEAV